MSQQLLTEILIVLEIIYVEFAVIWMLSVKKHSFGVAFALESVITFVLLLFMCFIAVKLPNYGNGSGRFMSLGIVYFIPVLVSYGGEWRDRIIIAFYAFSYGLACFALSVRFGFVFLHIFDSANLSSAVLPVQSLLFFVSFPFYIHFSKYRVMRYVQRADVHQKNLLMRYTISSFFLIILYNGIMVSGGSDLKKLFLYALLLYFIVLSYRLLVSYLKMEEDNHKLNRLAVTDRLTGLGNRLAMRRELDALMDRRESFYLIVLDLNNFKQINDRYGHNQGDKYLCSFAAELKNAVRPHGKAFRLGGDEFVCVSSEALVYERLQFMTPKLQDMEYYGVSAGMAKYPDETLVVAELLDLADQRMYMQKKQKGARNYNY